MFFFFASLIVISFIVSTLGTLLYAFYSVAVNGNFSTENRYKANNDHGSKNGTKRNVKCATFS